MKISVICPTVRMGGLDVLFHGLRGQTYRNFELVLVDGLRDVRQWHGPEVVSVVADTRYQVARPSPNPWPVQAYCAFANAGLRVATGDICLLVADYTWLPPDCLAKHAAFHRDDPDPFMGYMGPHFNVAHPPLHPDFPRYGDRMLESELQKYVDDVRSGRLDAFGWSIFEKPFDEDARQLQLCPWLGTADPKTSMPAGFVDRNMLHLKNESWKMSRIREAGGLNEDMDGSVCWQDSELADALGVTWTLDPSNPAYIVNPRALFPLSRRLRPEGSNEPIWLAGRNGRKWI